MMLQGILIMKRFILIILLINPGVWSGDWQVTLENKCALKGSSVVIRCKYDYPFAHIVTSVGWSKDQYIYGSWRLVLLSNMQSPPDYRYVGNFWTNCNLQINNVQQTDEGRYFFSFDTTLGGLTSSSFSLLSVRELNIIVEPSTVTEGENVRLTCESGCPTPVYVVWFRDGKPVLNPSFQAKRADAGRYYCAVQGQETVRSASVALNVQYAPDKVTLSMSPSRNIVKGSSVTFTCTSDANPPVTQSGYSLYKDGQFLQSGQNYTISDIQPSHSGLYDCHAWNNVSWRDMDFFKSTEVHLDVQYPPLNISISMNPPSVVGSSSVNLTCSSAANPAANYTWYKQTNSTSSMLYLGSGQVLSIPFVEASHTGRYLCLASNRLGNSTEMSLILKEEEHGLQSLPIIAGIGVFLFVTLLLALLFWRKQMPHAEKKATTSYEDEVVYSTVTIKPRHPSHLFHNENRKALLHQRFTAEDYEDSVIYSTVAKSS